MSVCINHVRKITCSKQLENVTPDESIVYLSFRPKIEDLLTIANSTRICNILLPVHHFDKISEVGKTILKVQSINLIPISSSFNTNPIICNYITLSPEIVKLIKTLEEKSLPLEEVHSQIAKTAKVDQKIISAIVREKT